MAKPKPPSDPNQAAKSILGQLLGDEPKVEPVAKNPAAVELGRKGGQARAATLAPEDRKRIAQAAAQAKWGTTGKK